MLAKQCIELSGFVFALRKINKCVNITFRYSKDCFKNALLLYQYGYCMSYCGYPRYFFNDQNILCWSRYSLCATHCELIIRRRS